MGFGRGQNNKKQLDANNNPKSHAKIPIIMITKTGGFEIVVVVVLGPIGKILADAL